MASIKKMYAEKRHGKFFHIQATSKNISDHKVVTDRRKVLTCRKSKFPKKDIFLRKFWPQKTAEDPFLKFGSYETQHAKEDQESERWIVISWQV